LRKKNKNILIAASAGFFLLMAVLPLCAPLIPSFLHHQLEKRALSEGPEILFPTKYFKQKNGAAWVKPGKEFIWNQQWFDVHSDTIIDGELFLIAHQDRPEKELRDISSNTSIHRVHRGGKSLFFCLYFPMPEMQGVFSLSVEEFYSTERRVLPEEGYPDSNMQPPKEV
jgi:hypothetical protein